MIKYHIIVYNIVVTSYEKYSGQVSSTGTIIKLREITIYDFAGFFIRK